MIHYRPLMLVLFGTACVGPIVERPAYANLIELHSFGQFSLGFPTDQQNNYTLIGYLNSTNTLLTPSNQIQYVPTEYTMYVYGPQVAPNGTFTGTVSYPVEATELSDQHQVIQSITQQMSTTATDTIVNTGSEFSSTLSINSSTVGYFRFTDGTTVIVQAPSDTLTHTGVSIFASSDTPLGPVATGPLVGQYLQQPCNFQQFAETRTQCEAGAVASGAWLFLYLIPAIFDPPPASAYGYVAQGGNFTQIFSSPSGLGGLSRYRPEVLCSVFMDLGRP